MREEWTIESLLVFRHEGMEGDREGGIGHMHRGREGWK